MRSWGGHVGWTCSHTSCSACTATSIGHLAAAAIATLNVYSPGDSHCNQLFLSHCQVHLPAWALWLRPGINGDYNSPSFRLYASSPGHPEVALQLDLHTGSLTSLQDNSINSTAKHRSQQTHPSQQQQKPLQQRAPSFSRVQPIGCSLVSQRLWATAPDGAAVPFTLVHKAGQVFDRPRPLLVEVYGAYGHVLESEFKPHRLPLLDRGWSVALAHVRGGGELGRR